MAVTLTINGVGYPYSEEGETGWGDQNTEAIQALAAAALYPSDVVNDLTTGGAAVPLSAAQGVALEGAKQDNITSPTNNNIVTTDANGQTKDSGKAFDTDGTLAGNSDNSISTEKAVKAYVDTNNTTRLKVADIDDTPANDADTAVSSQWIYNNLYSSFEVKTSSAKTTDYTITDTDGIETVIVGDTDNDRTITLPTAADNTDREITVYNNNSYSYNGSNDNDRKVVVQAEAAGETINGVDCSSGGNPINIEHQYCGLTFKCNGSVWFIIRTIGQCEIDMTLGATIEIVYTKFFTGTTDIAVTHSFAHGVDWTKIIMGTGSIHESNLTAYVTHGYRIGSASSSQFEFLWDATNVIFGTVGTNFRVQPYKATIKYYL